MVSFVIFEVIVWYILTYLFLVLFMLLFSSFFSWSCHGVESEDEEGQVSI